MIPFRLPERAVPRTARIIVSGFVERKGDTVVPIYEYACRECGHRFETLVRSGVTPECPDCGSGSLDKQLSVFAAPAASVTAPPLPAACGACGHPDGPGSCAFD